MPNLYNQPILTPQDIRDLNAELPDTVQDELFSSFIVREGDTHLQSFLGTAMYQEILTQYTNNTLTTANEYIYKRFIKPIMSNRVMIKLVDSITYQIEASGLRIKTSDQSDDATVEGLTRKIQTYQNYADLYSQQMVCYINENIQDYPLFYSSTYCTCNKKENYMFGALRLTGF